MSHSLPAEKQQQEERARDERIRELLESYQQVEMSCQCRRGMLPTTPHQTAMLHFLTPHAR